MVVYIAWDDLACGLACSHMINLSSSHILCHQFLSYTCFNFVGPPIDHVAFSQNRPYVIVKL